MDEESIILANIERYRALLQGEHDDDRRSMIRKLLAEDETKLARLLQALNSSGNPVGIKPETRDQACTSQLPYNFTAKARIC